MNNQNDDFEGFLRQFQLRDPRPLPEAEASYDVRRRTWNWTWAAVTLAAVAVVVVALLPAVKKTTPSGSDAITLTQNNSEKIEGGNLVRAEDSVSEHSASPDSSGFEKKTRSEPAASSVPSTVGAAAQPPVATVQDASPAVGLTFDVATIKPQSQPGRSFLVCQGVDMTWGLTATVPVPIGHCQGNNVSLEEMISGAYRVLPENVTGGPGWIYARAISYELEARADDTARATAQQLREMLQNLLADRFRLLVHREIKEVDGYVLLGGKTASRLRPASGNQRGVRMNDPRPGHFVYEISDGSMPDLAELLSGFLGLPVIDKSGLAGTYDYTLTIDRSVGGKKATPAGASLEREFDPPVPIAIDEQLGLRMERQKVPAEILVIDRAERLPEDETERVRGRKK
jgi:uncharacterized protein (TIGR03435 family)